MLAVSKQVATHSVGQRRLERARERWIEELVTETEEEEEEEEEKKSGLTVQNNLKIETAVTEEEVDEGLEAALNMEMEVVGGDEGEGE